MKNVSMNYLVILFSYFLFYNLYVLLVNRKRQKEGLEPVGVLHIPKKDWLLFLKIVIAIILITFPIIIVFLYIIFNK